MNKVTITLHDLPVNLISDLCAVLGGETAVSTSTDASVTTVAPGGVFDRGGVPEAPAAEVPAAPTAQEAPAAEVPAAPVGLVWPETCPEPTKLDKRRIPHDSRIHNKSKTKTAKSYWKNQRGIDKDYLAQVEAELFAIRDAIEAAADSAPGESSAGAAAPVPNAPVPDAPVPNAPVPDAPAAAPAAPKVGFRETIDLVNTAINEQMIAQDELDEICEKFGLLNGAMGLASKPDMIEPFYTELLTYING